MERKSYNVPGYDCRRGPCPHTPKCRPDDGGISGGRYLYTVRDGDLVAVVDVFAHNFPDTVPEEVRFRHDERPIGGVSIHAPFPTDREDVLKTKDKTPAGCEFLDGKPCWLVWSSGLALEKYVPLMARGLRGEVLYEQPAAFWAALETWLASRAPEIRAARADTKWKVCRCCNGEGTVASADPDSPGGT